VVFWRKTCCFNRLPPGVAAGFKCIHVYSLERAFSALINLPLFNIFRTDEGKEELAVFC
jgi:hypothetical protein